MNFVALDPFFYGAAYTAAGPNLVKIGTEAPLYLVNPRNAWLPRTPKLEIYPVTVVNLLGKYGDFETDSNSDGLADGWTEHHDANATPTYSLVTDNKVFGSKSQKVKCVTTSTDEVYVGVYASASVKAAKVYYAATYAKILTGAPANTHFRLTLDATSYADLTTVNAWTRVSCYFTVPADGTLSPTCDLYAKSPDGNSVTAEAVTDGCMLINLTEMGQLRPPLQTYLGVTNWADLATTSNIKAVDGKVRKGIQWLDEFLPYVNSIGTLGYTWGA